ncbi:MAG: hypothetical protein AAFQ82_19860, partial [Myxococcota bacterium]
SSFTEVCTGGSCINGIPTRNQHGMTFNRDDNRTYVFGGRSSTSSSASLRNDLWAYSGTQWRPVCTTCSPRPSVRQCAEIVYDEARGVLVLHGGTGNNETRDCGIEEEPQFISNQTWEWDGSAWTQLCGSGAATRCSAPSTSGHELVYDPNRFRSYLLGGGEDVVWEWDGVQWRVLPTVGAAPESRLGPVAAYDRNRREIAYGLGTAGDTRLLDFWRLPLSDDPQPSVQMSFDWNSAGILPVEVEQVEIEIEAGGSGWVRGTPSPVVSDGARIDVWNVLNAEWDLGMTVSSSADAPQTVTIVEDDPERLAGWLSLATGKIVVRVRSIGSNGNGPSPAEVAVDFAEVRITYSN